MDPDSLLTCQAWHILPQRQKLEIHSAAAAFLWRHQKSMVFDILLEESYEILSTHQQGDTELSAWRPWGETVSGSS